MIQIVLQAETAPKNDYVNTKLMQAQVVSESWVSISDSAGAQAWCDG
jgi:hypothetical protein